MTISEAERGRISAAIRAVEAKTSGEIVCVLAHASSDAQALPVFIAAVVALVVPWLLVALTTMPVHRILSIQGLAFIVLTLVLCAPRVRASLLPRRARRTAAHRAAMEQFMIRGISRKKERTGILIFVSLAEHYARIIADDGISSRVPQSEWEGAVDALVDHMRGDRVADGFIVAIERCGKALEAHFPRTGTSRDELPDRIYVI